MISDVLPADPESVGPYRLLGRLGAGGMGQVYLASSPGGRRVAVKVIRPDLASDSAFRSRFSREVAAARTVGGIYTALVVDADAEAPVPWLATAYVAGPSLAEAVGGQGPLPAESVRRLAAGLAEGLQAIHRAGLVHRDLKPSNVLLDRDGPKVIDFGISRAADASSHTMTGVVLGSPGYMSPEQARGPDVGPESDVFSLGAVLVFAATGEGPWGAGPGHAVIYRLIHQRPGLSKVPSELRPLIERCLAKDPTQRPTPAQLLAELGEEIGDGWLPDEVSGAFAAYESAESAESASGDLDGSGPTVAKAPGAVGASSTEVVGPGQEAVTQLPGGASAAGPGARAAGDPAAERDRAERNEIGVGAVADIASPDQPDLADRSDVVEQARQSAWPIRARRGRIGPARIVGAVTAVVAVVVTVAVLLTSSAPPAAKDPDVAASAAAGPTPTIVGEAPPSTAGGAARTTSSTDRPKSTHHPRTRTSSAITSATTSTPTTQSATTADATTASATTASATTSHATQAATTSTTSPPASVPLTISSHTGATEYPCSDAPAQGPTGASATFTLNNDSSTTVDIGGQPVEAGGSWSPSGAIGDVWTVTSGSGACLGVFKQTAVGSVTVT